MLTPEENDWLKRRRMAPTSYCGWCMMFTFCCDPWFPCPIKSTDWQDAAEFEARVAAKMADWLARDMGCFVCGEKICKKQKDRSCGEKLLQAARLAAEEEIRESGALRRTSMELTRALADLRRPG